MFEPEQGRARNGAASRQTKVHSIPAMLRDRSFAGRFELSGVTYKFKYVPSRASLSVGKLMLEGKFSIGGEAKARVSDVKATLLAAQGGIGNAPPRKKLPPEITAANPDLPIVESTGSLSFAGVLYFKLSAMNSRLLGIPADMTQVQLNLRLAPVNEVERLLQAAFSSVVDAAYGKEADRGGSETAVRELNSLLAG